MGNRAGLAELRKVDVSSMGSLLEDFPGQCRRAAALNAPLPRMKTPERICFVGMGGSAIGGDILRILLQDSAAAPFIVHRDYGLPACCAGDRTLVVTTSYSGNTEETVSAYDEAKRRGCALWVLASGGDLLKRATADSTPFVTIPGGFPPRCCLGYLFLPCMNLFHGMGLLADAPGEDLLNLIERTVGRFVPGAGEENEAFKFALRLQDRVPLLYSGALLSPALVRWKTQLAENSKMFAFMNTFPEMNHNEIMAWHFPERFIGETAPVLFRSSRDGERIGKRMDITRGIVSRFQPELVDYRVPGSTLLEELFHCIILGDWVSYYLALLNRTDPTRIDEITFLKKSLS